MNSRDLIQNIILILSSINPYKVILFGSFAYGEPGPDSDIDLIVILKKEGFPGSYNEKMENHRLVRKVLRDINMHVPLDVIVYTIDEWNAFLDTGSSFSRHVTEKGKAIA